MARKSWIEKAQEHLREELLPSDEEQPTSIQKYLYELRKAHCGVVAYHAIEDIVDGVCMELAYELLIYGKIKLQNERK